MTRRKNRILNLRREGYRIWKIAKLVNATEDYVLKILIDAGLEQLKGCELILHAERKPTPELTQERLHRMRASRRRINQRRRIGGGNWSGRNA